MCQLLKLREKKTHQQHLRTKSNHLQQARLCGCVPVFTRLWLNLLFLRHNLLTQSTGFSCCTRCNCITAELSRVLPTVSLTEDATAGTRVVLTQRGRPICNLTNCQTLWGSRPSLYSSPQPPTARKALAPFPNIHANIWYSVWNCISPLF